MNDKREASHLPSARAGLWPLAGNLQARGWGVLKTSPGSLLRSPTSTGVRAHSTAGSTRHSHVGGWHPGVSACLPSPAPGPCPTATIRRWHAPISRVKVQALAQAHGGGGGGALLPAGLCFHLQRNFQEGNSSDPLTLPVTETVGNEEVPDQPLFLEETDFKCWKSASSLYFHLSQSREGTCMPTPRCP